MSGANERSDSEADWSDLASVRAAIAEGARGELPYSLLGSFDPTEAAHVATLLALESRERRTLFDHGTWANWETSGINHGALYLADSWARSGRFGDALTLLDDLVVTRHLTKQTYQLALWAIQNDNSKLGVQPARARVYLENALRAGRRLPAVFHNALCVFSELGDEGGALHALSCALRYGYDPKLLRDDVALAPTLARPALAALMQCSPRERATLLLRERLTSLVADDAPIAHTPRRVAARALVLAAVSWRASLPGQRPLVLASEHADATADVATMRAWLAERGLDAELEPRERALFDAPFSTGMIPECVDSSWALEAAAMLGWALGRTRRPQYQQKLDAPAMLRELGVGTDAGDALLATSSLRPASEIRRLHRQLLTLHWRMEEWRIRPAAAVDLESMVGHVGHEPAFARLDLGYVKLARGDVEVAGKPLSTSKATKAERVASLALERYRALTWLVAPASTRMCDVDTML